MIACLIYMAPKAEATEPETLGTWIDSLGSFWRQEITITDEDSKYYRTSVIHDGSSNRAELIEIKARPSEKRRFKDKNSNHGEIYAIDNQGNLDLYDGEGFIREAKKK